MEKELVFKAKDVKGFSPKGYEDSFVSRMLIDQESVGSEKIIMNYFVLHAGKKTDLGSHPPPFDEIYYILRGQGKLFLGDSDKPTTIGQDFVVFIPAGMNHSVVNDGSDDLELITVSPGPFTKGANLLYDERKETWGTSFRFVEGKQEDHFKATIVDAHQHFWSKDLFSRLKLPPKMNPIIRDFQPGDLRPLIDQVGVDKTVLVQTNSSLENTVEFLDLADQYDWIAAVVGWVDLTDPDVGKVLDRFCAHPKFKGVRHQWEDEADSSWILRSEVIRGLRELPKRGLSYDLLAKPHNWEYITRVADEVPDLNLVIDHIAKPNIAEKQFDDWTKVMERAAQIPKMMCKLSGMNTEADWNNWTTADLKPYIDKVIEAFGPDRVMFGSDWPVCLLAGSYERVFKTFLEAIQDYEVDIKSKILGKNAIKFYRI